MIFKIIVIVVWCIIVLISKWWRDEAFFHKVTSWMNRKKFFRWWLKQKRPFDPWHFCDGVIITGSYFVISLIAFGWIVALCSTPFFFLIFYGFFNKLFRIK